jgi:hypothetical protein
MVVKARNLLAGGVSIGLLALAGCNETQVEGLMSRAQAPCPRVGVIADAADLTRFRAGGGTDLTAMEVDARVSGFQAKCNYASGRQGLVVTLTPQFSAERGPAAPAPVIDVPYMVAVVGDDDQVLSRAAYALRVAFPPNVSRVQSQGEELSITLAGGVDQAASRRVLIGFQLSPEELAANRRRGPR